MFCSFCKNIDGIKQFKRKICNFGHILCEKCDKNIENCPACETKFSKIAMLNNTPRLFIDTLTNSEETFNDRKSVISKSDSMEKMLREIESCEKRKKEENDLIDPTYFKYFEVVSKKDDQTSSENSGSLNEEEEFEIMKCYEKVEKKNNERKTSECKGKFTMCSSRDNQNSVLTHREVQTSFAYNENTSRSANKSKTSDMNQEAHSIGCYDFGDQSAISLQSSVFEIYKNPNSIDESDTLHFTSLAVSRTSTPPPDSPPKSLFSSIAHRVKFSHSFNFESTRAEPILVSHQETLDSSNDQQRNQSRKLSRFPVPCPISHCETWSVPSDFCNHLTIDHPCIDVLKVAPGKIINMKLNFRGNPNIVMCQRMFLIKDKMTDIGYGTFENCLPVVLMTSNMTLQKIFGFPINDDSLYVWLVGVYDFQLSYTITLWTVGRDETEPTFLKSMSNFTYLMKKPLNPAGIISNALSIVDIKKHIRDGQKFLSCQITFH
ncbi:CLUMA_CG020658, isoform A [Clunio marinus]|uniref:CLUMA_CG020658, isoform A n=1 Tax=Clunio marinus TaxID=568069 RepID=A0A1J1J5L5_9DIPT|nr:CLUMA_CG020658, isoform A [Clunio marinus]